MRSLHWTGSSVELIMASRQCRYFVTEYQNVKFSISLLLLKIEMLGLPGYESGAIVQYPSCLILNSLESEQYYKYPQSFPAER